MGGHSRRHAASAARNALIAECGRLPLAIALCGAMLRDGTPWSDLLEAFAEHDLDYIAHGHGLRGYEHPGIFKSIDISVKQLDESHRQRLYELSVFPADQETPEAAVLTLWEQTGSLRPRHARELLTRLERRSLLMLAPTSDQETLDQPAAQPKSDRQVSLHDLIYDYATSKAGPAPALHQSLLDAYARKCPNGWPSGPDDGYFSPNLWRHLRDAGRLGEAISLIADRVKVFVDAVPNQLDREQCDLLRGY